MTREEALQRIEELREHLMDELTEASKERNRARTDEIRQGETALDNLERVV